MRVRTSSSEQSSKSGERQGENAELKSARARVARAPSLPQSDLPTPPIRPESDFP